MSAEVFDDLADEYARLSSILSGLGDADWRSASAATGWSVADVVTHLALTEEGVTATLKAPNDTWTTRDHLLDSEMDDQVRDAGLSGPQALERWQRATEASLAELRAADPTVAVRWAAAPLRPRTLATTRLAEHWAHALDVTGPLAIAFDDTDRLRHIAWLGHATLPYAFQLAGLDAQPVHVQLVSDSGSTWTYGPAEAESTISGSIGAFCRVGAQRLSPADSGLVCTGPASFTALSVLRNYAA